MPELRIKFDRHGLGDCVHFAHALQLYKRRGYDITVQAEENKLFVWKVAGVNIVQGGGLPDHSYHYPAGFDDLSKPDHETNKVAFGLRNEIMPPLEELGLTQEQAWDELCAVRLSAHAYISPEAHAEAERFLEGMPRPIICFHSRGTNWHERKSIPTDAAFETILKLLDQTGGSVIVLDFDRRAPMVGDARCKGIKPTWGHVDIDRLCALLERTDLLIGVDSGPFHLAAFTNVKALGVFRSLLPNRVCLPNPNAVYLAGENLDEHWCKRRPVPWNIATYSGPNPTADDIVQRASEHLNGVSGEDMVRMRRSGRYLYRRVGYDERIIKLEVDGTISDGAEDCERRWTLRNSDGIDVINIHGKAGVICSCNEVHDNRLAFRGCWTQFEKMPIELIPLADDHPSSVEIPIIGDYFCELIGDREFPLRLIEGGKVESPVWVSWRVDGRVMELDKPNSDFEDALTRLQLDADGCWRGESIELIQTSRQPFRSFGPTEPIKYQPGKYHYTNLEEFNQQCVQFARSLPPVRAIAGVPRSGLLAASIVAMELNCPMIPLESLMDGTIPEVPVPRRGRGCRFDVSGIVVVIDDNCSSGRVIASLRPKLHASVKIGVILGNDHADFIGMPIRRDIFQSYEWTILHDDNTEFTLVDLDGVLCEDWSGGDETVNLPAYEQFLNSAKPRRKPSYPLLGVVTNRLERHRRQTEEWLAKHGIRYGELMMSPYATFRDRDAAADASTRKAEAYANKPTARLFIESCGIQARAIRSLTGRPVLSVEDNRLV